MRASALADDYAAHLERWLHDGEEGALEEVHELARRAIDGGLGVVDMTELHHQALSRALEEPAARRDPARTVRIATAFLAESLLPFESAHRACRESNGNLRRLNQRLESDAKRVAHAIHSEAGQLLATAAIALEHVGRELPEGSRSRLAEVTALLDQVHRELQHLSHELRPPMLDQLGLLPALRFLAERVSRRSGVAVRVQGELAARPMPAVETALYRIVQEALSNVVQHAGAESATVRVWKESGRLCCSVRDRGKGFEMIAGIAGGPDRGLGLVGIRERLLGLGGTLHIEAAPGRGTDLVVSIPTEE